jgi:hypothetical protein
MRIKLGFYWKNKLKKILYNNILKVNKSYNQENKSR